jgi:hypothetical protein
LNLRQEWVKAKAYPNFVNKLGNSGWDDTHSREFCAELEVIDRGRRSGYG